MTTQLAELRYQEYRKEADAALADVRAALERIDSDQRREPENWEYAGSMCEVVKQLNQVAAFLFGGVWRPSIGEPGGAQK